MLVGEACVGDRSPPAQVQRLRRADLVQPPVDLGVHPADEEGGHRRDGREVTPRRMGLAHAVQEGAEHLVVAVEGEDQRHVDADAFGKRGADRLQAGLGGGDLHEHVPPVHQPPQGPCLGDRCRRVVSDARVHLERPPSVYSVAGLVHRSQYVAGPPHVERRQQPDGFLHPDPAPGQITDLLVVAGARADRLGEDRRIAGDTHHLLVLYQVGQPATGEPLPAQIIEPDSYAFGGQPVQVLAHDLLPCVVSRDAVYVASGSSVGWAQTSFAHAPVAGPGTLAPLAAARSSTQHRPG